MFQWAFVSKRCSLSVRVRVKISFSVKSPRESLIADGNFEASVHGCIVTEPDGLFAQVIWEHKPGSLLDTTLHF